MWRDTWHHVFIESKKSSSGTADVFKAWFNGVQIVDLGPAALFDTTLGQLYWKFGIYRGDPFNVSQVEAVRWANIENVNKAVSDITSRITNPLALPTHN